MKDRLPAVQSHTNPHLDADTDRDPAYDYDHAIAHGTKNLKGGRRRQLSLDISTHTLPEVVQPPQSQSPKKRLNRRGSHDEKSSVPRQLYINVEHTQRKILAQEDTDGDCQITITDQGPKSLALGTLASHGHKLHEVRGTYALANLLQELALANDYGRSHIVLEESRLLENPVDRLSRMIKHHFWDGLTRRIDAEGLEIICLDPKNRQGNHCPRIYVPYDDPDALEYYQKVAVDRPHLRLDVVSLPQVISPEYVKSINGMPGILALALQTSDSGKVRGVPFVVPGGRFNEMYGWDSYFEVLGLLVDGRILLSQSMVTNFVYQIKHYGKILNANRSYYLTRSQPPFLTDMALQVYKRLIETSPEKQPDHKNWLAEAIKAAVKEYHNVWMSAPRYVKETGLSRFCGEGKGMPPETEASHFDAVLKPFADKLGLTIPEYSEKYNSGKIVEPALDEYFMHDRAVRESGHDTTYRLEGKCANICPIDLNALLYKYEIDIGTVMKTIFKENLVGFNGDQIDSSEVWFQRAADRKANMNKYLWNEEVGMYFDYDITEKAQNPYESVTCLFALWAGVASQDQALRTVLNSIKLFEVQGGLLCGTEKSRGLIGLSRPNRQWDFPFGWAPHQIIAWKAMQLYGFDDLARRCAYRWLFTITKSFVDFNGVVPEKFDIVNMNHKVNVEYGNVGIDFKFIPREGFGWMNSSFKVGLQYMTSLQKRALGTLVHPDTLYQRRPSLISKMDRFSC